MAMQWYVVTTLSSHEDKVRKLIERQKSKWPDGAKVGQVKIPLHEMAELRGGKKRIVKKKLMPGYVFIEAELTDELQHRIRALPPEMPAGEAFRTLLESGEEQLPVMDGTVLLGMLRRRDMFGYIERQRKAQRS